jgi:hypothetical protein
MGSLTVHFKNEKLKYHARVGDLKHGTLVHIITDGFLIKVNPISLIDDDGDTPFGFDNQAHDPSQNSILLNVESGKFINIKSDRIVSVVTGDLAVDYADADEHKQKNTKDE